MGVETHPASETLAAFARGDLPANELSDVALHLAECQSCLAAIERVPDDTIGTLARAAGRPDVPAPTALASMPSLPGGLPDGLVNHPRYRILSELGAGGMGVVYKAEDQMMGRTVALKVVAPHLIAKANAADRFFKEIRAAARLNHANIVQAYDMGEAGGAHFLVMEYVEGTSLDRYVARKGPLPIALAAQFARQAAQGLQHAAEKGMVHRDIKPQNLMITRKGQVKVMDFGLARLAQGDEPAAPSGRVPFGAGKPVADAMTNPNLLLGTPDYLSPEQARNSHLVDARSDVYSLGCTLYFLLTGQPPFAKAVSLIDKLLAHTEEPPPPVRGLRPEVPEGLAAVLARMMAKKPGDRYGTAGEAASALAPFARGAGSESPAVAAAGFEVIDAVVIAPSPADTARPVPTAAAFAFDTPADPSGRTLVEPPRAKRRKAKRNVPWWQRKWTLGGAAVLSILLVVAIIASGGGKKKDEAPPDEGAAKGPVAPPGGAPRQKGKDNTAAGGTKVLCVLPSSGVWVADYLPVRQRLEKAGIKVETASTDGESSKPFPNPSLEFSDQPVKIDHKLTASFDAEPYAAVVFCGADTSEYTFGDRGEAAARAVIRQMKSSRKPVAAICLGQMVLVGNDAIRGKRAAGSVLVMEKMPGLVPTEKSGIIWVKEGVVRDGKLLTGATDKDAIPFADALVAMLR